MQVESNSETVVDPFNVEDTPLDADAHFGHKLGKFLKRKKTLLSLCYCLAFACLGLALSAPGPSLLALRRNTESTVSQIGYAIAVRSFGYLIGSGLGGPLFDRFNGNKLISMSLVLTAFSMFVIPEVTSLWLLGLAMSLSGIAMGLLDTGANVSTIWLHGDDCGPYMQSLHFSFGVGALIAPMIVGGVMEKFQDNPAWAFRVFGLFDIPIAFWIWIFPQPRRKQGNQSGPIGLPEKIIVILTAAFLFFDVGAELSNGGYLYSYAITMGLVGETESAFLTSGFWGALTLGRLISIPASIYLTPAQILLGNLIGCIVSCVIWLLFLDSKIALWIGCIGYGLGISCFFPTSISLAETYVALTGRLASFLVVGGSFGEFGIPLLVAQMFDRVGPVSLIVILLVSNLFGLLIYGLILIVGRKTHKKMIHGGKTDDDVLLEAVRERKEENDVLLVEDQQAEPDQTDFLPNGEEEEDPLKADIN